MVKFKCHNFTVNIFSHLKVRLTKIDSIRTNSLYWNRCARRSGEGFGKGWASCKRCTKFGARTIRNDKSNWKNQMQTGRHYYCFSLKFSGKVHRNSVIFKGNFDWKSGTKFTKARDRYKLNNYWCTKYNMAVSGKQSSKTKSVAAQTPCSWNWELLSSTKRCHLWNEQSVLQTKESPRSNLCSFSFSMLKDNSKPSRQQLEFTWLKPQDTICSPTFTSNIKSCSWQASCSAYKASVFLQQQLLHHSTSTR